MLTGRSDLLAVFLIGPEQGAGRGICEMVLCTRTFGKGPVKP